MILIEGKEKRKFYKQKESPIKDGLWWSYSLAFQRFPSVFCQRAAFNTFDEERSKVKISYWAEQKEDRQIKVSLNIDILLWFLFNGISFNDNA